MSLRKRTLLVVGSALVGLMLVLYLAAQFILLDSYRLLEEQSTKRNVNRVQDALATMLETLNSKDGDWANWDDAYHYALDPGPEFIAVNATDKSFSEISLDLMVFLNTDRQVVFAKAFDLRHAQEISPTAAVQQRLAAGKFLPSTAGSDESLTGIVQLPEGPLMLSARPILDSNGDGPSHGTLIFARYLDQKEVAQLASTTHLSVEVRAVGDPQLPDDFRQAQVELADASQPVVRALDASTVAGYALIKDVEQRPAAILRVSLPRDVYAQGRSSLAYFLGSQLLAGLFFGALTLLLLDRNVLSRLSRLSTDVSRVGSSGNLAARVVGYGRDEIANLVAQINRMLAELERSEHALRQVERRRLLDAIPDRLYVLDRAGICLEYKSGSAAEAGARAEDMVGHNLREMGWGLAATHQILAHVRLALATQQPQTFEQTIEANGRTSSYETRIVRLSEGEVLAIVRDISRRKRAESRIRTQLQRLAALHMIDQAINASTDLRVVLQVFLSQVVKELHVDAADVLLYNQPSGRLEFRAGTGFRSPALKHTRLRLGEGYAGTAALERKTTYVPDLMAAIDGLDRSPLLPQEDFISYFAVPLEAKGQVTGVLEIFHRERLGPDDEWLDFLNTLASQAAIALDNAGLYESLQRKNNELIEAYDTTLEGWSLALELRDSDTGGHTLRVAELTLRLAGAMGIPADELIHLRRGALLHDIGKMGVPDSILLKPGPLTDDEWQVMRMHPVYAHQMLSRIRYLEPALPIPYCHHEKWDGTGYPRGLKGTEIPLAARIFAVVDVWDALCFDRPYRAAWPEERVRAHIQSLSGTHFDPDIVATFLDQLSPRS